MINDVKYINYDYWIELTNGSRLPKDSVEKIKNNDKVFNVSYEDFLEASETFKKTKTFDEIIIVSDLHEFVVLEGHLRLTVYALNKDILPDKISVIIGVSGFLVIMTVSYGVIVCKRGVAQTGRKITVSLIQGNIEQKKKWDPKFAESIM